MKGTPSERDVLIVTDPQRDFCPGGALAAPDGDAVMPAINRLAPFRACRHHAGLAPAGAYVLRQRPSRPKALRDDRGGLRPADLVAGSLRPAHGGRRAF